MINKCIAYLDMIGFGNLANLETGKAWDCLLDYQTICNISYNDKLSNSKRLNHESSRASVEKNLVDSFEYFLPFSDSLFIQSSEADIFIRQISSFLFRCFSLRSQVPIKDYPPILFQGGISYGKTIVIDNFTIVNNEKGEVKNIVGPALVNAVNTFDKKYKSKMGPRLFCDGSFFSKLTPETQRFWIKDENTIYEVLWPSFYFIDNGNPDIGDLIRPVKKLLEYYKGSEYIGHYEQFMELVFRSIITYYKYDEGCKTINKYLDVNNMSDIKSMFNKYCKDTRKSKQT